MAQAISELKLPNNATYVLKDGTITPGTGITFTTNSSTGARTIANSGVRSITTGASNGTISVNTNGTTSQVAVNGLGSAAYTNTTAYATAAQGTLATNAMPKSGGTFTGNVILNQNPTSNLQAATKQYVDNIVSVTSTLSTGTQIATLNINGTTTTLYSPGTPTTISVIQSSTPPTLEFITSTNTSASATLTGVTSTTLQDGKMIVYRLNYTLPGTAVSLTLVNTSGTSLGNYPVYIDGTHQCTAAYITGTMLFLTYYQNKWYIANPFALVSA